MLTRLVEDPFYHPKVISCGQPKPQVKILTVAKAVHWSQVGKAAPPDHNAAVSERVASAGQDDLAESLPIVRYDLPAEHVAAFVNV